MPEWSGHVIVTCTADGTYWVGRSMPPGVPLDYATVQVFEVSGPHELVEGPGMVKPPSAEQWIDQYKKAGFTFKPQPPDEKPPHSDLASAITPGQDYTAEQIAGLFKTSKQEVERWWANVDPPREPRLRSRLQTGAGPHRVSSAYDLLEFLYHYENQLG